MHCRPHIYLINRVVLQHAGCNASEKIDAAVAKENTINDSIHFFEHLLDPRGRPHWIEKVDLVGVDPLVGVVDGHGALALHPRRQRVVLLAEERQLHLAWQEVLHELVDEPRADGASCARDHDVHAHVVAGKVKIVCINNRRHEARLSPQVLYSRVVNLLRKYAAERLLHSAKEAFKHGLLLRSASSLVLP